MATRKGTMKTEGSDELRAARGILLGAAIGAAIWLVSVAMYAVFAN